MNAPDYSKRPYIIYTAHHNKKAVNLVVLYFFMYVSMTARFLQLRITEATL